MIFTTAQADQPMDDLEEAQGSGSSAEIPPTQPKQGNKGNSTTTKLQPGQHTEAQNPEKVIVLSFRSLQLQRIAELQDELLRLTFDAAAGKATFDQTEKVDRALDNYAKALRNYETLSLNALSEVPRGTTLVGSILSAQTAEPSPMSPGRLLIPLKHNPRFLELSQRLTRFGAFVDEFRASVDLGLGWRVGWRGVRSLIVAIGDTELIPSQLLEVMQRVVGDLGFRELDPLGREKRSQKTALIERIIMAMFGGVALIAPMLIMTLHPSRNTSLITTSLATFVFALILAVGATTSAGKDVLAATAAYAAVLVVFVGTNTSGSSQ